MDEGIEAKTTAALPERYRQPDPPEPDRVGNMRVEACAYVKLDAIHIDENWGLWLDPAAPIIYHTAGRQMPEPIRIDRKADGYIVHLEYAADQLLKRWKRDEEDLDFKAMIPVRSIR